MAKSSFVFAAGVCAVALLSGCVPTSPITPSVTFAGVDPDRPAYLKATGSVTGVAEDGGKCVFTFWADSGVATRLSGSGKSDGNRTACGPVDEELGFLAGVNYEVELKYVPIAGDSVMSERVPMVLPKPTAVTP